MAESLQKHHFENQNPTEAEKKLYQYGGWYFAGMSGTSIWYVPIHVSSFSDVFPTIVDLDSDCIEWENGIFIDVLSQTIKMPLWFDMQILYLVEERLKELEWEGNVMRNVNVKKLKPDAVIPIRGSKEAAGYDLYACLEKSVTLHPGETFMIPTGLAIEVPKGYFGGIFARSGLASKKGLAPANKVGVVDSDYRGEWFVPLHNHSLTLQTVEPKERIAQVIFIPYESVSFCKVDDLSETNRGVGGFGSTGTN